MRQLLIAALLTVAFAAAHASEHVHVCARDQGGKMYSVEAELITGQELIQRTNNLSYQSFSKYVAIFWTAQQVTLINVGGIGDLGPIPLSGTDQQGRQWQVSSTDICN